MWSVGVLSSITSDTDASIIVTFDSGKYLFNCGEGTSRAIIQSGRGFRKFRALFASQVNTDRTGGVPGLLMTLADSGTNSIKLYGPRGLKHFLASTRFYTIREEMSVAVKECDCQDPISDAPIPILQDENLSVYAIPIGVKPETSPTIGIKRRRSTEELMERSQKRQATEITTETSADTLETDNTMQHGDHLTIYSNMATPDDASSLSTIRTIPRVKFDPSQLSGAGAEEWKDLILRRMFRGMWAKSYSQEYSDNIASKESSELQNCLDGSTMFRPLPPYDYAHSVTCYVGVATTVRGKFDAKKAQQLGLKHGPDRGRLIRGETVTLKNGTVITPEMCLGTPERPTAFMLVDCPSPAYISEFLSREQFNIAHYSHNAHLHLIIHVLGEHVLEDERYKEWMHKFGPDVHHIIGSRHHCADFLSFTGAAQSQLRLSKLDENMFPKPKFYDTPEVSIDSEQGLPSLTTTLQASTVVRMRPPKPPTLEALSTNHANLSDSQLSPSCTREAVEPTLHPEISEAFREAQCHIQSEITNTPRPINPGDDVIIITLGTGSAMPTKYRNVSSTLVRIPRWGSMLLDAGEGTWGQLARHFSLQPDCSENAWTVLRDIRCIFISHSHGDHMAGISKILTRRKHLQPPPDKPLFLVANYFVIQALQEYSDIEDLHFVSSGEIGNEVVYISCKELQAPASGIPSDHSDFPNVSEKHIHQLKADLGARTIQTTPVDHSSVCHALIMHHQDGWSLGFSGDTIPCDRLVEAAKDVTLLIHEATLGDDQCDMALKKKHSTFSQALDVGRRANARYTLLNHFSARYPRMPELHSEIAKAGSGDWCIAFDNATFRIGDLWKMKHYLNAFERNFTDGKEEQPNLNEMN